MAAPLAYLMSNDFERVTVEKLDVDGRARRDHPERDAGARLARAHRPPLRPGSVVPLQACSCARYRGETRHGDDPGRDPGERPGRQLHAAGRRRPHAWTGSSSARCASAFVPRTSTSWSARINGLRRNNHVYARLLAPRRAAPSSAASTCQSLPPSVLSVLGAADQGRASSCPPHRRGLGLRPARPTRRHRLALAHR